jgi:hypothetical protein
VNEVGTLFGSISPPSNGVLPSSSGHFGRFNLTSSAAIVISLPPLLISSHARSHLSPPSYSYPHRYSEC